MPTVHFTIDGTPVSCEKDALLLDVALAHGFDIPHPCRHRAQEPYGACRLCLVEITQSESNWVEASCTYPVREEGMSVRTDSEKVRRYRRLNLELLLARCPGSAGVREMARELGLAKPRFPEDGTDTCILCGLCVSICRELVGVGAISFACRGPERRVTMPYDEPSAQCIGCGACAEVCPTGNIIVRDSDGQREIAPFGMKLSLVPCPECGQGYVTGRQLELLKEQVGDRSAVALGCPVCRRRESARELSRAYEAVAQR